MRIIRLFALASLSSVSCFPAFDTDPGPSGTGGAHASSASSSDSSETTADASSSSAGGAGGAGCAGPVLDLAAGDVRFVADDLTRATVENGGWRARTEDHTLLLSSPASHSPVVTSNAFGCHQGVKLGYSPDGTRWFHSAETPIALVDATHSLGVVVRAFSFDPQGAALPQTPGVMFLGGVGDNYTNSAIGFSVTSEMSAAAWFGGYGLGAANSATQRMTDTVYVLFKVYEPALHRITGYLDSVIDWQGSSEMLYDLENDVGIGGGYFQGTNGVTSVNGLQTEVAEALVFHRALGAHEVKTISCKLSKAYGGGPLNCL